MCRRLSPSTKQFFILHTHYTERNRFSYCVVFFCVCCVTHLVVICGRVRFTFIVCIICIVLFMGNGIFGMGFCFILGMFWWMNCTNTNTTLFMVLMNMMMNLMSMWMLATLNFMMMGFITMNVPILIIAVMTMLYRSRRFVMFVSNNMVLFPVLIMMWRMLNIIAFRALMMMDRFIPINISILVVFMVVIVMIVIVIVTVCGFVFVWLTTLDIGMTWLLAMILILTTLCLMMTTDRRFNIFDLLIVLLLIIFFPWIEKCSVSDLWLMGSGTMFDWWYVKEFGIFMPFWRIIMLLIIAILYVCVSKFWMFLYDVLKMEFLRNILKRKLCVYLFLVFCCLHNLLIRAKKVQNSIFVVNASTAIKRNWNYSNNPGIKMIYSNYESHVNHDLPHWNILYMSFQTWKIVSRLMWINWLINRKQLTIR